MKIDDQETTLLAMACNLNGLSSNMPGAFFWAFPFQSQNKITAVHNDRRGVSRVVQATGAKVHSGHSRGFIGQGWELLGRGVTGREGE